MAEDVGLQPGQRLGPFEIVAVIGEGGMGVIYDARHLDLDTRVALKTMRPELASSAEARERFLREGRAASRIEHPNVVRVMGANLDGGVPYLVMELLRGETLAALLGREAKLTVETALELLVPVISAVAAGHERGIVHRDLKPQNIFLSRGYRNEVVPKVLDFGVSKFVDDSATAVTLTSTVLGTAAYMAPEQAIGRPVDPRCDQYAMGLILYEAVTGQRGHRGDNQNQVLHAAASADVVPADRVDPSLPREFVATLARLLAREPDRRYPSMRDAGAELLPFASAAVRGTFAEEFQATPGRTSGTGGSVSSTPRRGAAHTLVLPSSGQQPVPAAQGPMSTLGQSASAVEPWPPRRRGRGWLVASAVLAVAGGGGVVAYQLRPPPPHTAPAPPARSLPAPAAIGAELGGGASPAGAEQRAAEEDLRPSTAASPASPASPASEESRRRAPLAGDASGAERVHPGKADSDGARPGSARAKKAKHRTAAGGVASPGSTDRSEARPVAKKRGSPSEQGGDDVPIMN